LLVKSLRQGMRIEDIARDFDVSTEMAAFRVRATGASRQVSR
jgi:uncharacterized protein (DUF433 family)